MKKLIFILVFALALVGCSSEKSNLETLLVEQMRSDKEQQDYNLNPEAMATCVLTEIDHQIPGFTFGPKRDEYYLAYINYLKSKGSEDVFKVLKEARDIFGSLEDAREKLLGYSSHVMYCMGAIMPDPNIEG